MPHRSYVVRSTCGEVLVRELIAKHAIIDVDDISVRTLDRVLAIAEAKQYAVVSGHAGILDLSPGHVRSEAPRSAAQIARIGALGRICRRRDVRAVNTLWPAKGCSGGEQAFAGEGMFGR